MALYQVQYAAIPSLLIILLLLFPLQYYLSYRASIYSYETTALITKRIHIMSEVITAIKLIKFYVWERCYQIKISKARAQEISKMKLEMGMKVMSYVSPISFHR